MKDPVLAMAQANYLIERARNEMVRDIEYALGEAIGSHRNSRQACQLLYMLGWLEGAKVSSREIQEGIRQITETIGGSHEQEDREHDSDRDPDERG